MNDYLEKAGLSKNEADLVMRKLGKYEDLLDEMMEVLKQGGYLEDGIMIEGYTAQDIAKIAPGMGVIGVYCTMVDLREDPDWMKQEIEKGLRIM